MEAGNSSKIPMKLKSTGRSRPKKRVLVTEFEPFTLFNVYFPNGKRDQERLDYKMDFY